VLSGEHEKAILLLSDHHKSGPENPDYNPNKALAWIRERPKLTCKCGSGIMRIIKTMIPPVHWLMTLACKSTKEEAALVM